mgnify:CR=1 FL=1
MAVLKIGHGFDVHALTTGDGLILGGVSIPGKRAFIAHSDGDVLIHALCDALLGGLGLGDIGTHFSDQVTANKNRDSREFLRLIQSMMLSRLTRLGNADITIVAQTPKMSPYLAAMKLNLAADLDTDPGQINIKATTTEKLGYTGREEGIAVHAVVLLEQY